MAKNAFVDGTGLLTSWGYAEANGADTAVPVADDFALAPGAWRWTGATWEAASAAAAPRYVQLATIRERVTAAGKWDAFAGAVDSLSAAKRWHLLTLQEGVASDDPDATALLTAIGCDPAAILAE